MIHLFNEHTNALDVIRIKQNSLVFSSLREYYQPVKSEGFAIKYVVEGVERYKLNNKSYPIETGKYLLTNDTYEGSVEIEANRNVKGICININPQMIAEVLASKKRPDTAYTDNELGQYLSSTHFLENQYSDTQTQLGKLLRVLTSKVYQSDTTKDDISTEFFYAVSEKIIEDQIPVYTQLQAIPSLKPDTKKDLYRRLQRGKDFIDNYFTISLSIETIAQEACMSEYHFFRLFRIVFGLSPNQYLIQKRLEYGRKILLHDRNSVSIAAIESGFSDIHTFSKAFKRHFGTSPSHFIK
ncbi:helix-turn-helix domain-containing protein [Emticicia fontis]